MSDVQREELQIKFKDATKDCLALVAIFRETEEYPILTLGIHGVVTPERRAKIASMMADLLKELLNDTGEY